ncbi:zinc finger, ZZ type, partial [Ancylostoma duodenale]
MEPISVKLSYAGAHRRFKIKGNDFESLFADLMTHVAQLSAQGPPFDIAWQDEDGDSILISRSAELGEAIESRKDNLLRLHTIEKSSENSTPKSEKEAETRPKTEETPKEDTNTNDAIHGNILCDVCDATIIGTRYKCILCADYDLCQNCERTGVHAQHGMVRIVDPMRTYVPWGARLRYPRQPGEHHHAHRSADPHGVIHRFRMQEKKEQLSEQVAKGMQYLTDIGQVVTSALANFGIDASYEVQVPGDKKEEKAEDKTQEKGEPKTKSPEEKKDEKAEKSGSGTPKTPSSPPSTPKSGTEDDDCRLKKEKKNESEKRHKFAQPVLVCPKKKFDKLQSAEAAYRNSDNSKSAETAYWKFNNLQSAEAAFRRAAAKTSDGSAKTSENRREQDAEMKKEKRTAPLFGAGVRDSSSSCRKPYSFRMPSDSCDIDEVGGRGLYDEYQRRRNEDRYDERRSPRYGYGVRFEEQKRMRDGYSDMSSRDRHRWWSPSYDDDWTSSSRRGCRYDDYDPYDSLYGSRNQRNNTFGKEEKAKSDRESRFGEKKPTEMKQKRSVDFKDFGTIHERENDVRRRAMKLLDEVSGRKNKSHPTEEGLKAAVEEAARESNGRDTNCRCFVAKLGRSQIRSQTCPSCQKKVQMKRSGQSTSRYPYMRGMSDEAVP